MKMTKTTIKTFNNGAKIEKIEFWGTRYKVRLGKNYVGKTTDGGYSNKNSAIAYAKTL